MKKLIPITLLVLLFRTSYAQTYHPHIYYPTYYYGYPDYRNIPDWMVNLDSTKGGLDVIVNMSLAGPGNAGILIGHSPKKLGGLGFFVEAKFIMLNYNERETRWSKTATEGSIFNAGIIIPAVGFKKDGVRFYLGGGVNREIMVGYGMVQEFNEYPANMSLGIIYSYQTLAFSIGMDHKVNGYWEIFDKKSSTMINFGLGLRL
jgi:hypothetical protein